jgi:hypothetical protein
VRSPAEASPGHDGCRCVFGARPRCRCFSSRLWDRGTGAHRPNASSLFLHRGSRWQEETG